MCHVLIIEDDPFVAMHLSALVEGTDATSTEMVDTEADAVTAAEIRKLDVILSDVRLIEGTGASVVDRIRKDLGPIPVIFVTGTPEECKPCDYAATVLNKPVSDQTLIREFIAIMPLPMS